MPERVAIKHRDAPTIARSGSDVILFLRCHDEYEAMRLFDTMSDRSARDGGFSINMPTPTFCEIDAKPPPIPLTPWQRAKAIFWGEW